jgi:hypothetical protein
LEKVRENHAKKIYLPFEYNFFNPETMRTNANNLGRYVEDPKALASGGGKAVYEKIKLAHADFVRKRSNEPDDFHWSYGYMMTAAYLHGSSLFQKNQEDNINQWLWSYWRWVVNQSYTTRE